MSFEGMTLSEDALRCYDELESSFAHVLREKNLSWFGTLIIPGPKDDSLPLLSITKKPYRDLIVANTVSVFDLRIYMLANQCNLLGKMGKFSDICDKVAIFLTSFGRQLREVTVSRQHTDLLTHITCSLSGYSTVVLYRILDVLFGPQRCRTGRCLGERHQTRGCCAEPVQCLQRRATRAGTQSGKTPSLR